MERRDEFRVTDAIAYALEAKRIGLREGPRDQHMWVFQRKRQGIFAGEIHIGFVQKQDTLLSAAKLLQLRGAVAATAGRIRRSDKAQGGRKRVVKGESV